MSDDSKPSEFAAQVREYTNMAVSAGLFVGVGYLGGIAAGKGMLGALGGLGVYFAAKEGILGESLQKMTEMKAKTEVPAGDATPAEQHDEMTKLANKVDKPVEPSSKQKYELYKKETAPLNSISAKVQPPPQPPKHYQPPKIDHSWQRKPVIFKTPTIRPIPLGNVPKSVFIRGRSPFMF